MLPESEGLYNHSVTICGMSDKVLMLEEAQKVVLAVVLLHALDRWACVHATCGSEMVRPEARSLGFERP